MPIPVRDLFEATDGTLHETKEQWLGRELYILWLSRPGTDELPGSEKAAARNAFVTVAQDRAAIAGLIDLMRSSPNTPGGAGGT